MSYTANIYISPNNPIYKTKKRPHEVFFSQYQPGDYSPRNFIAFFSRALSNCFITFESSAS